MRMCMAGEGADPEASPGRFFTGVLKISYRLTEKELYYTVMKLGMH